MRFRKTGYFTATWDEGADVESIRRSARHRIQNSAHCYIIKDTKLVKFLEEKVNGQQRDIVTDTKLVKLLEEKVNEQQQQGV
jgi:hypothetical protein